MNSHGKPPKRGGWSWTPRKKGQGFPPKRGGWDRPFIANNKSEPKSCGWCEARPFYMSVNRKQGACEKHKGNLVGLEEQDAIDQRTRYRFIEKMRLFHA